MNQDQLRAIHAKKFKVGTFVKNDNDKFGRITKINHDNPDGSRFFNVRYTFGNTQQRSDHQVTVIPKSNVPQNAMRILYEK
jgi:hypothetical protein